MVEPLTYQLPNGTTIHCLNRTDAQLLYAEIFDEDIYYRDVVRPVLDALGIGWGEFRWSEG